MKKQTKQKSIRVWVARCEDLTAVYAKQPKQDEDGRWGFDLDGDGVIWQGDDLVIDSHLGLKPGELRRATLIVDGDE